MSGFYGKSIVTTVFALSWFIFVTLLSAVFINLHPSYPFLRATRCRTKYHSDSALGEIVAIQAAAK